MAEYELVTLAPEPFAYVSRTGALAEMPRIMSEAFCTLGEALGKAGVTPTAAPFAHYREVRDGRVAVDVGFPIRSEAIGAARAAGLSIGETASGEVMRALHVGAYDKLGETYEAVIAAMRARGLSPAADMWERYLTGPETPPEQMRTEVWWAAG